MLNICQEYLETATGYLVWIYTTDADLLLLKEEAAAYLEENTHAAHIVGKDKQVYAKSHTVTVHRA